jgi:hypothetical protein
MAGKDKAAVLEVGGSSDPEEYYLHFSNKWQTLVNLLADPEEELSSRGGKWKSSGYKRPLNWQVSSPCSALIRPMDWKLAELVGSSAKKGLPPLSGLFQELQHNASPALWPDLLTSSVIRSLRNWDLKSTQVDVDAGFYFVQFAEKTTHLNIWYCPPTAPTILDKWTFSDPYISLISSSGPTQHGTAHIDAIFDKKLGRVGRSTQLARLMVALLEDRSFYLKAFTNASVAEYGLVAQGDTVTNSPASQIVIPLGNLKVPATKLGLMIADDYPTIVVQDLGTFPKTCTPCLPTAITYDGTDYVFAEITSKIYC